MVNISKSQTDGNAPKINNLDVNFDKKSNHSDIIIERVTYDLKNKPTETSLTVKNQTKPIDNIEWKQKGN